MHPIVQQQYDTSFPPLTDTPVTMAKSGIQKTTKRQPRKTHAERKANQNGYWLKQPSPSNNNRFEALSGEENVEGGGEAKRNTSKAPPIFVAGVENIKPLKEILVSVARVDFELKVHNSTQVKIQSKSTEK